MPVIYFGVISLDSKGAGIFEWPGQTTEDVCAVSTIFIQFKWNFHDYFRSISTELKGYSLKGAGIFEWPSQTTEDVCAVSTILIQIKWNFQDYLHTIWASI